MSAARPPSTTTTEYDAVVIGAGYGGLITGAILSRNGMRTIVIDENNQVGGRGGSTYCHGYWLNFGVRDARDFGDVGMGMTQFEYGRKAAEAAGADVKFVRTNPTYRVHLVAEKRTVDLSEDPRERLQFLTEVLRVPPPQISSYLSVRERLTSESPEKMLSVTFRDWLPTIEEPLRQIFLTAAVIQWSVPPEETSVGRFIQYLRNEVRGYLADDPEVGGMQGFMEPYARAIRKYGGTIALGLKPFEILLENRSAAGVVVRDNSNTIQIFRAPVVVFAHPVWDVFELLSEDLFPRDMVEDAWKLHRYDGDVASINLGLSRLPTIRATGQPETYAGWNRVLHGPERRYGSGWHVSSLLSRKTAPDGKHLLSAHWGTAGRGCTGFEPFDSFATAKAKIDTVIDYASEYYRDLDEITEFKTYHVVKAPATIGYFWKPVRRAPLEAPIIGGLYFVADTTEVEGCYHDIDANAALQGTALILKRFKERS